MVNVAEFAYFPDLTEIRDAEHLLIRYFHDGEKIEKIDYFDSQDRLQSSQKFYWEKSFLKCKALFNKDGHPIFAKTFRYEDGNVVEEILWGQLTGNEMPAFQIDSDGNPSGAEKYTKTYAYYKDPFNLLKTEEEEDGPSYEYIYKPGTNLLQAKFTRDRKGNILIREFSFYDADHQLISEIVDDGISSAESDYTSVTQRIEKHYEINPTTGLPDAVSELYWDPIRRKLNLLKKIALKYSNQKIIQEDVFDAEGTYRYTIQTEYNDFGQITKKITPLGENLYFYDDLGFLKEIKEVGTSRKKFEYDKAGREISCFDTDKNAFTERTYDKKGRVLSETDFKGHTTIHVYDVFGNRKETKFPKIRDESGSFSTPISTFQHDLFGNLTEATMPLGETTRSIYNLLRKPLITIQPDGSKTEHFYNKNGTLAKTILPDFSEIHYEYDLFQRITSKIVLSPQHDILAQETWGFNAFNLLSHTDSRRLTTMFFYDGSGRKIEESAGERTTTYSYDNLGFLERIDNGVFACVQKHNASGQIIEEWQEDSYGRIENRMQFSYDSEGRKKQVIRVTSQGLAIDSLVYEQGRLSKHTDPQGAITQFLYNENFIDDSGQKVLQKTTIDPLRNATIETNDIAGRISTIEKRDSDNRLLFSERFYYDQSGNRSKRRTDIFIEDRLIRTLFVYWKYDSMGRVIEENEGGQKRTQFLYDARGRIRSKILPNGIEIKYQYDGIDRIISQIATDGTVHDEWVYQNEPEPVQIIDYIHHKSLWRTYTRFGELIKETSSLGFDLSWEYDKIGRISSFILPNLSSVAYYYQGLRMIRVERHDAKGNSIYSHEYLKFDRNGHVAEENLIFNIGSLTTAHDLLERPSSQTSPWLEQSVTYGLSGLVETRTNSLLGDKTYEYDALRQLKKEGDQAYFFDSLGNPAKCSINDLNQLLANEEASFTYDLNGNMKEKIVPGHLVQYSHDALDRLTEIIYPQKRKIKYFYDPLSRLSSKETQIWNHNSWIQADRISYLYDQTKEVGTLNDDGSILEFKTLGLGIKGDIGAAIAIEINEIPYAPLHDFSGNILALISSDGHLKEKYEINAFGAESSTAPPINPWRFCSKRTDEGLVFFGLRFYDPSLGRWITPDPSGFSDSSNLYVYVLNCPLNRLDLFGLYSFDEFANQPSITITVPIPALASLPSMGGFLCKGEINGVHSDFYIFHTQWHKLQFTPEEHNTGQINLLDHLHELIPTQGKQIVLTSFGNGISTSIEEFNTANRAVAQTISGPLMISLYNQTEGLVKDISRTRDERKGVDTPIVCKMRQFLSCLIHHIHKINPESAWLSINHSENGVILKRSIEGASPEDQEKFKQSLHILAIGPADCVPQNYGASVSNIYSDKDYVTGFGPCGYAKRYLGNQDYEMKILPCISNKSQRNFWIADHGFLMPTYRKSWEDHIDFLHEKIGFYGRSNYAQSR